MGSTQQSPKLVSRTIPSPKKAYAQTTAPLSRTRGAVFASGALLVGSALLPPRGAGVKVRRALLLAGAQ